MGKFKRTEGPPAYGEGYHKHMMLMIRLRDQGAEVIHREIADLWAEIMLRTDCLVEHEFAQAQDVIAKNKHKGGRKCQRTFRSIHNFAVEQINRS